MAGTINIQGDFWVNNYKRDVWNQKDWADKFDELESEPICSSSIDTQMVLDASKSVGSSNFSKVKEFIADKETLIQLQKYICKFWFNQNCPCEYSKESTTYFTFANNLTIEEMNSTIRNVFYSRGETNQTEALFIAVRLHKAASPRAGVQNLVATFSGNTNSFTAQLSEAIYQVRCSLMQTLKPKWLFVISIWNNRYEMLV